MHVGRAQADAATDCFGMPLPVDADAWVCQRCAVRPGAAVVRALCVPRSRDLAQKCVLCPNAGGALKLLDDGRRWAHVLCATWVPETSFGDVELREPITLVENIPRQRWLLVCVCGWPAALTSRSGARTATSATSGSCTTAPASRPARVTCRRANRAQCSKMGCFVPFHVSCAHDAGLSFTAYADGEQAVLCQRHGPPVVVGHLSHCDRRHLMQGLARHNTFFEVGARIVAKCRNNLHYEGVVENCEVRFGGHRDRSRRNAAER